MDKKHVDGDGDGNGDGDVLLKEQEQEKQSDGGESLTMPPDVASMKRKRKRSHEDDQDDGGDAEAKAKAKAKDEAIVRKYYKQVAESEGFDFDEFPEAAFEDMDMPLESLRPIHLEYAIDREIVTKLATEAGKYYNEKNKTSYVVDSVDVERANVLHIGQHIMYYITFKAKKNITSDGDAVAFQAKIEENFEAEEVDEDNLPVVEVNFCRLKRTDLK